MTATSETRSWDALVTSTLSADNGKLYDNIVKGLPTLTYFREAGRIEKIDGGDRIKKSLMYAKNDTVKAKTDYGVLDTTPQEGITSAFYDWREIAGTLVISRAERRKNSGKHQVFNLLMAKEEQLALSFKEEVIRQILGAGGTNSDGASEIDGLRAAIADTPTSGTYGGITRNTTTGAWWQNQYKGSMGSFVTNGLTYLREVYRECSQGNVGGSPDMILCDPVLYDSFEAEHVLHLQFAATGKTNEKMFNLGIDNFKYKRATVMYEEQMLAGGRIYLINTDFLSLCVDKDSDFKMLPAVTPSNQTATVAPLILMANLAANNCRKLGVITGGTA